MKSNYKMSSFIFMEDGKIDYQNEVGRCLHVSLLGKNDFADLYTEAYCVHYLIGQCVHVYLLSVKAHEMDNIWVWEKAKNESFQTALFHSFPIACALVDHIRKSAC